MGRGPQGTLLTELKQRQEEVQGNSPNIESPKPYSSFLKSSVFYLPFNVAGCCALLDSRPIYFSVSSGGISMPLF